jgi:hypothetical protein
MFLEPGNACRPEKKNRRKTGDVLTDRQAAHDFLMWVERSDG